MCFMTENLRAEGVRDFHIGDILSITTGRLVSKRQIEVVYDILNYMTGDDLFTHQLPRASEECAPTLRTQLPEVGAIEAPEFRDEEHVWSWLGEVATQYGETHPVLPLHPEDHTSIDPIEEIHLMGYGDKLITVELPPQEEQEEQ